jgi:hypothetical protein
VELGLDGNLLACTLEPNIPSEGLSASESPTNIASAELELFRSHELCVEAMSLDDTAGCCLTFEVMVQVNSHFEETSSVNVVREDLLVNHTICIYTHQRYTHPLADGSATGRDMI